MNDFRVPKQRVPVRLLIGSEQRSVDVFLFPVSTRHAGSETLFDVLNGPELFVPFEEDGTVCCVPRSAITAAWVRPTDAVHPDATVQDEHRVAVRLDNG